jgi:hypothetical protein
MRLEALVVAKGNTQCERCFGKLMQAQFLETKNSRHHRRTITFISKIARSDGKVFGCMVNSPLNHTELSGRTEVKNGEEISWRAC